MSTSIRAAVLIGPQTVELRSVRAPVCGPEDVIVAPRAIGICGSDLHLYRHGRIGQSIVTSPLVLGHESSGVVIEIGENVRQFKIGDRVVIEPGIACGSCFWCHHGDYQLCPRVRFLGIPPSDGTMAEEVVAPARFVHAMPDNLNWNDGAMIEPFAVALQAVSSAGISQGDSVVIMGAGPIGLMILQAARIRGATNLISVDIAEGPLAMARSLGATTTLDAREAGLEQRVRELTHGIGADHAIEAVGAKPTTQAAFDVVRRGGIVTLVGIAEAPGIPIDTIKIVRTGLTVRSCFRYAHQHPAALALASAGRVDLRTFVTHRYAFNNVSDAFRDIGEGKGDVIKAIVEIDG